MQTAEVQTVTKSDSSVTKLHSTEGPAYWVLADRVRILTPAEQTGGAYDVAETTVPPGGGPPPHVHAGEDEVFFILEGELGFVLGDRQHLGRAGDAVFLPRGVPHTFRNVGDAPAKFVVFAAPGGFVRFIADVGTPTDPAAPFVVPPVTQEGIERVVAGAAKAGIRMLMDYQPGPHADLPQYREPLWVLGHHVNVKLTAQQTGGLLSMADCVSLPGTSIPAHRHLKEDELFYVLEGRYTFTVDGEPVDAPAGTFLRIPRGTWHAIANTGGTRARLIDIHTPGGFEAFFRDCGTPCTDIDAGPPAIILSTDRVVQTILRHGMEVPAR